MNAEQQYGTDKESSTQLTKDQEVQTIQGYTIRTAALHFALQPMETQGLYHLKSMLLRNAPLRLLFHTFQSCLNPTGWTAAVRHLELSVSLTLLSQYTKALLACRSTAKALEPPVRSYLLYSPSICKQ